MAVKLIGGTLASINAYMCFTTDPVATWPTDCGAGSKMTVIDVDNKLVSSFALFDGENWSTFATSDLADLQTEIDSIKAELTGLEGGPEGFASRIDDLEAEKLDLAGGTMTGDIIFGEDTEGIDARVNAVETALLEKLEAPNGEIEVCSNKVVNLTGAGEVDIDGTLGNVFTHTVVDDVNYSITDALESGIQTITLIFTQSEPASEITFDNDIKWEGGTPDFSIAGRDYIVDLTVIDSSLIVFGKLRGGYAFAGIEIFGVTADDTANTLTGMAATMEFSTDDGSTWTTYNEDTPNLPDLTGELDILVRFKETATHYVGAATEFNFTKAEGSALSGVTADDTANTLTGMAATMEFSTDAGDTWTTYDEDTPNLPDLSGTVDISVRFKETAAHYAGAATEFNFTA